MGLLYQFPTDIDDKEHIIKQVDTTIIRSYGLPPIFWFYLIAVLIIYSMMALGISDPLSKLMMQDNWIDKLITSMMLFILIAFPIISIGFFFYEKQIIKDKENLNIIHRIFFINFITKKFTLNGPHEFEIRHHLDSPNLARLKNDDSMRGFQNKGHFELYLKLAKSFHYIDRSSRKADLVKLAQILNISVSKSQSE
jgi:hypothetical protein